jgi:CheY-like chemotaxis protein
MHFLLYSNHISSDDRFYLRAVVWNSVGNSMADIKRLDKKGNIKTSCSTKRADQDGAVKGNPAAGSEQWGVPAIAGNVWIASAVNAGAPSPPRPARILVMDDEEIIRNVSREIFSALGHSVEVAKHGQEALEKYQDAMAAGKPFDIVILDVTVRGGMGGSKTIQKLVEIDPAVKAVVSSGYSDDAALANHLSQGFKAYLKKPYNIAQLRGILNSLLP